MRFHMRHGEHKDNILTTNGHEEVKRTAENLLHELQQRKIDKITLACSPEPRAIGSCAIVLAVLKNAKIDVNFVGVRKGLRTIKGTPALQTITGKKYGQGMCEKWRTFSNDAMILDVGSETFAYTAGRVQTQFAQLEEEFGRPVVGVYHGGSIEPGVWFGLNIAVPDLPSAALVIEGDKSGEIFISDPNAIDTEG